MALSKDEMNQSHPDLNALAAFIDDRLSESDRASVIAHLGGCLECRVVIATHARGLSPATARTEVTPAGHRSRWGFRPAVWLPIAATLTLATTAAVVMWRVDHAAPAAPTPTVSEPVRPQEPVAPAAKEPGQGVAPSPTATPPAGPDDLATRRNAVRVVNGKTFRLVAGEWVDSAYDPVALLPVHDVTGAQARNALLERIPALAQYAALGTRVTVAHDGIVYRFR